MDDEDILKPKLTEWPPKELDNMSFEALDEYARQLEEEIKRVRKTLEAKRSSHAEADALFRK